MINLPKRLRLTAITHVMDSKRQFEPLSVPCPELLEEAADCIEKLEAENEQLYERIEILEARVRD